METSQSTRVIASSLQAGRQADTTLPQNSMASQEACTTPSNSTPSREGFSQEGSNPQSGNSLVSSQAGNSLVSTQSGRQAVRHSTRLRASQTDSGTPQLDSEASLASQASPQVVRYSTRLRTSLAPQENSTTPQVSRGSSQEGNTSPSTNSRANNPQGSSMEESNPKWVINLSSKPLTQVQRSVLAKGSNFAVSPRHHS